LDAAWAALLTGRPTINGYSSYDPPEWNDLADPIVTDVAAEARLRSALRAWLRASVGVGAASCWLLDSPSGQGLMDVERIVAF
jgi:hypothetical protein